MKVELTRTFEFNAAHSLPHVNDGHKCRHVHGHNFTLEVSVRGVVDPERGWLMDYGDIRAVVAPLVKELDHSMLNEVAELANPTSENIARWFWNRLEGLLPGLHRITIYETPGSRCTYWGEA